MSREWLVAFVSAVELTDQVSREKVTHPACTRLFIAAMADSRENGKKLLDFTTDPAQAIEIGEPTAIQVRDYIMNNSMGTCAGLAYPKFPLDRPEKMVALMPTSGSLIPEGKPVKATLGKPVPAFGEIDQARLARFENFLMSEGYKFQYNEVEKWGWRRNGTKAKKSTLTALWNIYNEELSKQRIRDAENGN